MNLMFWKKKAVAGEEAEDARDNLAVNASPAESLDFAAAKQDVSKLDPGSSERESSDAEEAGQEAPAKQGLFARMKLRLGAMARHFRKPPEFRADEDHAPDTQDTPERQDGAADAAETGLETPAKPALGIRIKMSIIAMVRRFRKTPAPDTGEDREPDSGSHGRSEAASTDERPESAPGQAPVRSRKWLVIGGSIAILALLLIDIGITLWATIEPPQKRWGTRHDITSVSSRPVRSETAPGGSQTPAPETPQTEIETLRKENAELQARIEALKKTQQPYSPAARQTGGNLPSSAAAGELTVGSKDPKASAMSLKEAVEAMNASSGDFNKKPAK